MPQGQLEPQHHPCSSRVPVSDTSIQPSPSSACSTHTATSPPMISSSPRRRRCMCLSVAMVIIIVALVSAVWALHDAEPDGPGVKAVDFRRGGGEAHPSGGMVTGFGDRLRRFGGRLLVLLRPMHRPFHVAMDVIPRLPHALRRGSSAFVRAFREAMRPTADGHDEALVVSPLPVVFEGEAQLRQYGGALSEHLAGLELGHPFQLTTATTGPKLVYVMYAGGSRVGEDIKPGILQRECGGEARRCLLLLLAGGSNAEAFSEAEVISLVEDKVGVSLQGVSQLNVAWGSGEQRREVVGLKEARPRQLKARLEGLVASSLS